MQSIQDKPAFFIDGFVAIFLILATAFLIFTAIPFAFLTFVLVPLGFIVFSGFTLISPNEAKVITFFGRYIGTIKQNGFLWTIPFSNATTMPMKIINFNTNKIKVNDLRGNPIEVAAVVVWRIKDAAQSYFNVDDYKTFVFNQSESVVRTIAAKYPYDSLDQPSLRGNADEISKELTAELRKKLDIAGIEVEDVKLSYLAYASEIAAAMLKRQQAVAVLEARKYMMENAMLMVTEVIDSFQNHGVVGISDDKKAEIMSNILVTLISDKEVSPVIGVS
jgi:regulator of protease activity HflC (stomatin/prohibitin superfamily)